MSDAPEAPRPPESFRFRDPAGSVPSPAPGVLLAARDALRDPHFVGSIVLLCQHGAEGAYGLVLNRPAHMPLREIFEHPPELPQGGGTRRVYIGGPVQSTELQILQVGDSAASDTLEVAPGIRMGGRWETLEDILSPDPARLRLFLGYAGWGRGQLEEEIEAGAWDVLTGDVRRLLETPEDEWASDPEQLRRFLASR